MYGFWKTIAVVDINTFGNDSNAKFKCFQEELLIQIPQWSLFDSSM